MKKIFLLVFTATTVQLSAQPLSSYNFVNDGYNISASFPGRPSKDHKTSNDSKMLTLTDTKDGVTYALILTNTQSSTIASQAAANTVSKLWAGASQRDVQQPSSIAGNSSTYLKYISTNGTYITSHTFSSGVMMCQAMVLQKRGYANEYISANFFSSISFGNYSSNNNQTYNPVPNNPVYKKWDKVEVYNHNDGQWYAGKIRSVNGNGTYEINYTKLGKDNEDGVTANRIRYATIQ